MLNIQDTTKMKQHIRELFESVILTSSHFNAPIVPTLGMFSDLKSMALKVMDAHKSEWETLIIESSKQYTEETNLLVNGVILINEARMTKLKGSDEFTQAKVLHYLNTVGTLEGCPYVDFFDVALCHCAFRNTETLVFMCKITEDENNSQRQFSDIIDLCDEEEADGLSGRMVEMTRKVFQNHPAYSDINC